MSEVIELADRRLLVFANGRGYLVDVEAPELATTISSGIKSVLRDPVRDQIILDDQGLWFTAIRLDGTRAWRSARISWDGFRDLEITGGVLTGDAYAPWNPPFDWIRFSLDLITGNHTGGNYADPKQQR